MRTQRCARALPAAVYQRGPYSFIAVKTLVGRKSSLHLHHYYIHRQLAQYSSWACRRECDRHAFPCEHCSLSYIRVKNQRDTSAVCKPHCTLRGIAIPLYLVSSPTQESSNCQRAIHRSQWRRDPRLPKQEQSDRKAINGARGHTQVIIHTMSRGRIPKLTKESHHFSGTVAHLFKLGEQSLRTTSWAASRTRFCCLHFACHLPDGCA